MAPRQKSHARSCMSLTLLVGLCFCTGCPAIQWYARQSGKGAVRGFYEGMADVQQPLRNQVLADMLGDPALRKVAHDLAASAVLGTVDGLSQLKLEALTSRMVENAMLTLRKQGDSTMKELVRDAGPALEQAMRHGVEGAILTLGASLHESAKGDMGAATALLMRAAVEGMLQALNSSGRELLADLNDNTERYLSQKVAPGAGQIARTLSREAVLGLQDGLSQSTLKDQLPAVRMVMREVGIGLGEGIGVGLGRSVKKSPLEPILTGISAVLGVLFLGAVVWLVLLWRRYTHMSKSLVLFAKELNDARANDEARIEELRRALGSAHKTASHAAFLERSLKRRGHQHRPIRSRGSGDSGPPDDHSQKH